MNLAAQIFGLMGMFFLFAIYQQKKREKLIVNKLLADICWTIHYLLLGGFAGMIPNLLGIFRELIFIKREEKPWANRKIWPILFIVLGWCMGICTFKNIYNILPIAASSLVTVSLWVKNPILTKIITVPVCISFLFYDILVSSYIGVINETISIVSIIISFLKERKPT